MQVHPSRRRRVVAGVQRLRRPAGVGNNDSSSSSSSAGRRGTEVLLQSAQLRPKPLGGWRRRVSVRHPHVVGGLRLAQVGQVGQVQVDLASVWPPHPCCSTCRKLRRCCRRPTRMLMLVLPPAPDPLALVVVVQAAALVQA